MQEYSSDSRSQQQAVPTSIVRKLLFTFILLVAVIIFNSIYSVVKANKTLVTLVQESMTTKLETVSSILVSELEKFTMIAGIVKEQRNKILTYLDYENYRSIQIMLQMVASRYDLDRIFFLDENKTLLLTDTEILATLSDPTVFQYLANDRLLDKTALATMPAVFFDKNLTDTNFLEDVGAPHLCIQAVVPIYHDLGDIYGYIVLVNTIDNNRKLAEHITQMADTRFVIYNDLHGSNQPDLHQPVLSNFPDTSIIPFPVKGSVSFDANSYLTQTQEIVNISNQPIGHLSVFKNREILQVERKRQLFYSLPPFIATILIAVLLVFLFQKLIIRRIYRLVSALQSVGSKEQSFELRLPVADTTDTFDEIDLMYLHFNNMMDQLQTTYEELKIAQLDAEAASIAKSNFLANMSHEIRTPMNAIIGLTDLMISQGLPDKTSANLQIIRTSSEALLGIINDVLDFSKIEAGMMEIEHVEFQLQDVLDPLIDLFAEKCAQKKLELLISTDQDVPASMIGDPLKLRQVMINLVANAIKFTGQGEIVIRIGCASKTAESLVLVFSVQDSGIGIKAEQKESLFTAFTQADGSHTRRYGGTGLGLTICRQIVSMMGGEIKVTSALGKGSIFTFSVIFTPCLRRTQAEMILPPELKNLRTLVVDDNDNVREIMSEVLGYFSCQVMTVPSAKEALSILKQAAANDPFQLVIIDWVLEEEDGPTLARKIKSEPQLQDIPLLLMSGFKEESELTASEAAAIDAFMKKPVKNSLLFHAILTVLNAEEWQRSDRPSYDTPSRESRQTTERLEVLVVEDNEINQQVARELLESSGITVTIAGNGQDAITILDKNPTRFDVVLMDIQMPEMDGFEATRFIRQDDRFQSLPIIAMTAHATNLDRMKSKAAGMDDHLTKPIRKKNLITAINQATDFRHKPVNTVAPPAESTAAMHNEEFPTTLSGLDIARGLKTVNNNIPLYKKLLRDFYHEQLHTAQTITTALQQNNSDVSFPLIHTIKGLAGNLGARDLYQASCELESAIKQEESDLAPALTHFTNRHDELLQSLRQLLVPEQKNSPRRQHTASPAQTRATIKKLEELIQLHDTDIEEYLNTIRQDLDTPETHELLGIFSTQLNQFNFSGARQTLNRITDQLTITLPGIRSE